MNWTEIYTLASKYYKDNNEKLIIDKTNEDEIKKEIRIFISDLKRKYKCNQLNEEEVKLLQRLVKLKYMSQKKALADENLWNSYYALAKKYYKNHGNLQISYYYTINNVKLGLWVSKQRCSKNLDKKKIELLDSIDMKWSSNGIWNEYYYALKKYKEIYGTILMDNNCIFNYNNKNYELGQFLNVQRNTLKKEKIEYILLDNLGMIWKDIDIIFAKEHEKKYNNTFIRTNNHKK